MEYTFRDLQKLITNKLLEAYKSRDRERLTFSSLLEDILKEHNLSLLSKKVGYEVRGCDGYNIITDMLYILKRMSDMGLIICHKQGDTSGNFESIEFCSPEQEHLVFRITGDFAEYITTNHTASIWISPEIEHFAENGFVSEELSIARKQADDARKTLRIAFYTLIFTFITMLVSIATDILNKPEVVGGIIPTLIHNDKAN